MGSGGDGVALPPALLEAEAVAVHLGHVDMVGKAIEQITAEAFRAEDLGPFGARQVAGDQR